MKLPPKGEE